MRLGRETLRTPSVLGLSGLTQLLTLQNGLHVALWTGNISDTVLSLCVSGMNLSVLAVLGSRCIWVETLFSSLLISWGLKLSLQNSFHHALETRNNSDSVLTLFVSGLFQGSVHWTFAFAGGGKLGAIQFTCYFLWLKTFIAKRFALCAWDEKQGRHCPGCLPLPFSWRCRWNLVRSVHWAIASAGRGNFCSLHFIFDYLWFKASVAERFVTCSWDRNHFGHRFVLMVFQVWFQVVHSACVANYVWYVVFFGPMYWHVLAVRV